MQTINSEQIHFPPSVKESLRRGETVALTESENTIALIVPALPPNSHRPFGLAKGEFTVPPGFNDPLPDHESAVYGD